MTVNPKCLEPGHECTPRCVENPSAVRMTEKVATLRRAFPAIEDGDALQLLQASGADNDIAFDAWLTAGDQMAMGTYGEQAARWQIDNRLSAALIIARAAAMKKAGIA